MAKIYLISPPKIDEKHFYSNLDQALKTGLVPVFQLRLKDYPKSQIFKIAKEIKKICSENNCLFIINDFIDIALEVSAGGVHVGIDDEKIAKIRQMTPKNFVIGASCYDSRHYAMKAGEAGADYISFGAFFPTTTKIAKAQPSPEILTWADEMLNLPIVAIGGINDQNASKLVSHGADFLAVISYVWNHPEGIKTALKKLSAVC
jgi:thiamine-phosphate pyrophosphorylase